MREKDDEQVQELINTNQSKNKDDDLLQIENRDSNYINILNDNIITRTSGRNQNKIEPKLC